MALKKRLRTGKNIAKSLRKTKGKKAKKTAKKAVKKTLIKKGASKKKDTLKTRKRIIKKPTKKQEGNLIGSITHYFPHVQAAVIKLKGPLKMGDTVKIKGHTTDLTQIITSMQIDRIDISNAKKGDEIGLQVSSRVRQNDKVYKI
jgi:translation elongation factor EF-Tu-like GTPase